MVENLSIVIPMYNEENGARNSVESILLLMDDFDGKYELIIVESGSKDSTPEIVDALAREYPAVRAVHQAKKEGLGSAIRLGFKESRMDIALYMDGDSPFDPHAIQKAIPHIKNCDAVLGFRIGPRESLKRLIFSKGYNWLIRVAFGVKVKDVNFSFKLIRKSMLQKLDLRSNGFFIDAEIIAELKRNHATWNEFGIPFKDREGGTSSVRIGPKLIMHMLKEMKAYMGRSHGLR